MRFANRPHVNIGVVNLTEKQENVTTTTTTTSKVVYLFDNLSYSSLNILFHEMTVVFVFDLKRSKNASSSLLNITLESVSKQTCFFQNRLTASVTVTPYFLFSCSNTEEAETAFFDSLCGWLSADNSFVDYAMCLYVVFTASGPWKGTF